ncbi:MAG: protein translocase subunit SecF [Patescibacteria group bacterium]
MNIIKHRKIFLSISGIFVLVSVAAILFFGLKPGIDFAGGTLWQVKSETDGQLTVESLKEFFEKDLEVKNLIVYAEPENASFLARLPHLTENQHQQYLAALKNRFGGIEELRYETIGPTIGQELRRKAVFAVILVFLGISLYVAFAFRKVSYPIKSWKYGVITLITLFHDAVIPMGFYAFLGWKIGIEIDINFIVAVLVIVGFSVHDTIVVFDRIRENLLLAKNRLDLGNIVNFSVNQTLARSVNTSLTLALALAALLFVGPASLKYFVLTILLGTVVGTYSSIFIASPLLTVWHKFSKV